MQSVNKIHVNSATKLSLNDRFSIMQTNPSIKQQPLQPGHANVLAGGAIRARRRSHSDAVGNIAGGARSVRPAVEKASARNRTLLAQLDRKHKINAALKIKRKSMRTNLPSAAANGNARESRAGTVARRAPAAIGKRRHSATGYNHLRATPASLRAAAAAATPTAGSIRRRRRSVSASRGSVGLAGRLGHNPNTGKPVVPNQRRRQPTAASVQQQHQRRSASAQRGAQAPQQLRGRSRSRSRTRENANTVQQQQQRRGRSASRGPQNGGIDGGKPTAPKRSRSTSRGPRAQRPGGAAPAARSSISARLGRNAGGGAATVGGGRKAVAGRPQQQQRKGAPVASGRVQKLRNGGGGGNAAGVSNAARKQLAAGANVGRRSRSMQRGSTGGSAAGRDRSQSRGRANARPAVAAAAGNVARSNIPKANRSSRRGNANSTAKGGAATARGRSTAAAAAGKGSSAQRVSKKTREQLDKELDQYMVNTKPYGDLDELMN